MTLCRRCEAPKKSDKGPFCPACAQHFAAIKRGRYVWSSLRKRSRGGPRKVAVTLPAVSICAGKLATMAMEAEGTTS